MTGKRKSNFLPERVSGALKSLTQRIIGACVCVVALWAVFAMLFYNPYLDGFGVSSTFGNQSIMGYLVGMETQAGFYEKLSNCFLNTSEDADVYDLVSQTFLVVISEDDQAKYDSLYGVTPMRIVEEEEEK